MEELFIHQDGWGSAVILIAKDDQIGIKTTGGLALLDGEQVVKLHAALTEHLGLNAN